ncbi:hypothetical protein E4U35_006752 [Claviceps purpurea]|uniref:Wings apart-like protein C-terminal domain-containing protein n=1 Tax=Claviceps purpurea (strain 20.1) TaxID=1111077 RepID=M1W9R4_CLAP2|nr:hypothetical protein E4U38_007598 [Claviceps purpurea]CCE29983.1 uncharacterized protein CPUR_03830 [Claviceps purpurea 20.1]KAG6130720.1 hypothetical protein E4U28_007256 [Claviceps purpurea]KAG6134196.1 hypothetical protein E4U12_002397 [Claviceps purpurea]KAG6152685.1 hypothetical protein E4U11_007302 [Claviceps purpurea]
MAASHKTTSQKKLATYGSGPSRKRTLVAKIDRNSQPSISSEFKLEQPLGIPESPKSSISNPWSIPSGLCHVNSTTSEAAATSKPKSSGLSHSASPHIVTLRKRVHSVAFAQDHHKGQAQCRTSEVQPGARSKSLISRFPNSSRCGSENAQRTATPSRRPRLIDALAAQEAVPITDDANVPFETDSAQSISPERRSADELQSLSTHDVPARILDRRGITTTNRKVRVTYRESRTIARVSTSESFRSHTGNVENDLDSLIVGPRPLPPSPTDAFALDDLEREGCTQPAIKSVHELRRAGLNNRFADELDDLLYRIGLPSSDVSTMRRNALCELVQKFQQKDFLRYFRDHASRDRIVRDVGKEMDPVCGFALITALICFLNSGPAPNLLRQLANDGVGKLLARLLPVDDDIAVMATQKKLNMSRITRSSLREIKMILQHLPIWHGYQPETISPRTAALQLMALLSRFADATLLDQILLESQRAIIDVATWASEQGSFDDVDYALTVFMLQTQSTAGVSPRLNSDGGHPTRISSLLSKAIRRWPSARTELESAILKLALNTTNTEDEATAFDDPQLSARLATCIGESFASVHATIRLGRLENERYDELLLMLGVMINIMEHCSSARRGVNENAMGKLMKLWQDNQQSVAEADSVNKSKLSVALGYLSVLLGYMCLAGQAREHIESCVGPNALRSLMNSIQQFAHLYKAVDSKAHAMDALVEELSRIE